MSYSSSSPQLPLVPVTISITLKSFKILFTSYFKLYRCSMNPLMCCPASVDCHGPSIQARLFNRAHHTRIVWSLSTQNLFSLSHAHAHSAFCPPQAPPLSLCACYSLCLENPSTHFLPKTLPIFLNSTPDLLSQRRQSQPPWPHWADQILLWVSEALNKYLLNE